MRPLHICRDIRHDCWLVYPTDRRGEPPVATFRALAEAEAYVMEHGAPHKDQS